MSIYLKEQLNYFKVIWFASVLYQKQRKFFNFFLYSYSKYLFNTFFTRFFFSLSTRQSESQWLYLSISLLFSYHFAYINYYCWFCFHWFSSSFHWIRQWEEEKKWYKQNIWITILSLGKSILLILCQSYQWLSFTDFFLNSYYFVSLLFFILGIDSNTYWY